MALVSTPKRNSTAKTALCWILINLLRLIGLAATIWAIVTHIHLLVLDVEAIRADQKDQFKLARPPDTGQYGSSSISGDLSTIITAPPTAIRMTVESRTTQTKASTTNNVGFNAVPNVNVGPTATMNDGVPIAIFPTQNAKRKRDDRGSADTMVKRVLATADDGTVSDGRYLPHSMVPNEPWGGVFAIISHLAWVCLLLLLVLGQAGQPEAFLLRSLPSLSISSSPLGLGLGQMLAGLSLQTHFLALQYRIPGFALMCVGLVNVHIALPLIINHQRTKHTLLSNEATVYQNFHCAGRIFPSRPVPPVNKGRLAKSRRSGFDRVEWAQKAESLTALPDKKDELEYPTFSGRSFTDLESQIPTMTLNDEGAIMQTSRQLHSIGEEDEDPRGVHGIVTARQPEEAILKQGPSHRIGTGRVDSIASANAELDEMYASQRLNVVGGGHEPPQINVVSPSTIASSSRFADPRYRRPLTSHSGKPDSVQSSAASSRSEASSIIRKAVPRFPAPPQRPPSALAHSVVTGPTEMAGASGEPGKALSEEEGIADDPTGEGTPRNSVEYIVPSPTTLVRQPIPVKGVLHRSTSERSAPRSVRFDRRPESTASGLSDYLPARVQGRAVDVDDHARAPSGHFSTFSAYTTQPANVPGGADHCLHGNAQAGSALPDQSDRSDLQVRPTEGSPPPSYRAVPGQGSREGSAGRNDARSEAGGQWFSRWRSNR